MAKIKLRKTFNLGAGIKVTASRGGIGASIGVKGARIGRGVDGKTRVITSIPGTGSSHQQGISSNRPRTELGISRQTVYQYLKTIPEA